MYFIHLNAHNVKKNVEMETVSRTKVCIIWRLMTEELQTLETLLCKATLNRVKHICNQDSFDKFLTDV